MRSGEHLVGTEKGIHKVSSVIRRAGDERWSATMMSQLVGSLKEPVPGTGSNRVTAFAKKKDVKLGEQTAQVYAPVPVVEPTARPAYIYTKDVKEHGPTDSCRACQVTVIKGQCRGYAHTGECRKRFEEIFRQSEGNAERVRRADDRVTEAIVKKS